MLWEYRAWLIDANGVVLRGAEEEITAQDLKRAQAKAWRNAINYLDVIVGDRNLSTVRMEYVRAKSQAT